VIIAEIGQNHNGDMALAEELIHAVAEAGAPIAKFQLFDAHSLFSQHGNPWFDYNCSTELTFEQTMSLAETCKRVGVEFMASAFDVTRVWWLEQVEVQRHKVASRSVEDTELVEALIDTGKPVLVSLGMWPNISAPPRYSRMDHVQFLYCVSRYPTPLEAFNLAAVDFSAFHGFSDHSVGLTAALTAIARGAQVVEKHFTLDKGMYGPDHAGSMTPDELKELVVLEREIHQCL
jgi:N-acetylneuraminate synthase/N,N'-diacetyllegionaminate synthase